MEEPFLLRDRYLDLRIYALENTEHLYMRNENGLKKPAYIVWRVLGVNEVMVDLRNAVLRPVRDLAQTFLKYLEYKHRLSLFFIGIGINRKPPTLYLLSCI
eukprot:NODE_738_length_4687_cov_0.308849.p10 type:complete len:101 gc:universal NODE_738_length_4687_cov_0.308849:1952-2254(+)